LNVTGTKGVEVGVGEEVEVALGKRVAVGASGVGVDVVPGVGVRVGNLIGDFVLVGTALGEGVMGAGTQAASTTSRVRGAFRVPVDKFFIGRLQEV